MSNAATPQIVDIDHVQVVDGHNPRTTFDKGEHERLTASIKSDGVLQPILVAKKGNRYELIAGERRVRAAKAAGLKQMPVVVVSATSDERLRLAIAENVQRADMTPIEEARAFAALAKSTGSNKSQLAKLLNKPAAFVSERLRLLELPEAAQERIAAGDVPLAAAATLRTIAQVSPAVADKLAELVATDQVSTHTLETDLTGVLGALQRHRADVGVYVHLLREYPVKPLDEVLPTEDVTETLRTSVEALALPEPDKDKWGTPKWRNPQVAFGFTTDDADAAVAHKSAIVVERGDQRFVYATDPAWVAACCETKLPALKKARDKFVKDREASRKPTAASNLPADQLEQQRTERRKEREREQNAKDAAQRNNLALGADLMDKLGSTKLTIQLARLLAEMAFDSNDRLGGGLRYVKADMVTVETTKTKANVEKVKTTYMDNRDAHQHALEWVLRPNKPNEVIGRLLISLAAAQHADETAVAQSGRIHPSATRSLDAAKLLDEVLEPVLPTRCKPRKRTRVTKAA